MPLGSYLKRTAAFTSLPTRAHAVQDPERHISVGPIRRVSKPALDPTDLPNSLVNIDLPAERVPLGRVELRIGEHGRVEFLEVDAQRGGLVVVRHRKVADDRVAAGATLRPPRDVVRAALRHPAELAPAVDVVVDDLCELGGGVERHEWVEGAEGVPADGETISRVRIQVFSNDLPAVQGVEVRVGRACEWALSLPSRIVLYRLFSHTRVVQQTPYSPGSAKHGTERSTASQ